MSANQPIESGIRKYCLNIPCNNNFNIYKFCCKKSTRDGKFHWWIVLVSSENHPNWDFTAKFTKFKNIIVAADKYETNPFENKFPDKTYIIGSVKYSENSMKNVIEKIEEFMKPIAP